MSDVETKIKAVIEQVRPYLEAEGGSLAFESFDGGVVHLLMRGPDSRCASQMVLEKLAVERRLLSEFNEVERVEISAGLVPIPEIVTEEPEA